MDYAQAREHVDAMLDTRERWSAIQALIDATDLDERDSESSVTRTSPSRRPQG